MDKTYMWIRVTGSQILSKSPVNLGTIVVTPDDATQGALEVYDGESDKDPLIIKIKTGSGITKAINFQPYFISQRGLYVKFISGVSESLVYYSWEKE